jgi:FkbM family methyltransferase
VLDRVPDALREPLWQAKHSLVRWLQRHALAEAVDAWLEKQLLARGVEVVLDVGANRGQYGRLLRRVGFRGTIHSFEPVADNYGSLAARAGSDPRWVAHHVALGDAGGWLEMNVTAGDVFCSALAPSAACATLFGASSRVLRTERVPVLRLDELLPRLVPRERWHAVHLKLDTQGYDLRVLRGLGDGLGALTSIQTELSLVPIYEQQPGYLEVLEFLRAAGFAPTGFFPVTRDPKTLRVIEYDAFFCRG